MADSDIEENFTFGSFTAEDTMEFKRNYNGLPKSTTIQKTTARPAAAAPVRSAAVPEANGGIETSVAALRIGQSSARGPPRAGANAPGAAADARDATKSPRRTQSPELALPVAPRMTEGVRDTEVESAPVDAPRASEEKPPPPPPPPQPKRMSWAAIAAAGASKPGATPASTSARPSPQASEAGSLPPTPTGGTRANGDVNASGEAERIREQAPAITKGASVSEKSAGENVKLGSTTVAAPLPLPRADAGGTTHAGTNGTMPAAGSISGGEQKVPPSSSSSDPSGGQLAQGAPALAQQDRLETEVVNTAAVEAARTEAEAKAKAAAELTEQKWRSVLGMLGREDGALSPGGISVGLDLVHRGLVNTGNSCFRSVVLQALLACEPFIGVLFQAAPALRDSMSAQTALPTWAQLARFASAFEPPKPGAPAALGPKAGGGGAGLGGGWSVSMGRSRGRHHVASGASTPVLPDEAMSRAFGAFRSANTGEQEDAQEFLAFFLDQLHEEVVRAKKEQADKGGGAAGALSSDLGGGQSVWGGSRGAEDDAWLEVGKGRTKAVVNAPNPRRVADSSVVTGLFYGMFRSEVKKSGSAKSSVTLEPFHCLQLNLDPPTQSTESGGGGGPGANGEPFIPNHGTWGGVAGANKTPENNSSNNNGNGSSVVASAVNGSARVGAGAWGGTGASAAAGAAGVTSVDQALAALFAGEAVAGVKGRRNLEVKASRTLTLEQAPRVLTLHLKQFSFHPEFGPRKLARRVRYPLELTIPTRIMSPSLQHQASTRGPLKYRLFTVVLHHGRSLHGGHYTALVRDARGEWRHCDDQMVSPETEGHALNPMSGHPYLLLYTRM